MTIPVLDSLQRAHLDWPEPLVLDLIAEIYRDVSAHEDIWTAARLHGRFLRHLAEGETRPAGTARLELIACCAARAIDPAAIEWAEQAVFRELTVLARTRFRNSPRHREQVLAKLKVAQNALTKRAEASSKPAMKSNLRRQPPMHLRPSLVPAG